MQRGNRISLQQSSRRNRKNLRHRNTPMTSMTMNQISKKKNKKKRMMMSTKTEKLLKRIIVRKTVSHRMRGRK